MQILKKICFSTSNVLKNFFSLCMPFGSEGVLNLTNLFLKKLPVILFENVFVNVFKFTGLLVLTK